MFFGDQCEEQAVLDTVVADDGMIQMTTDSS